MTPGNDSLDRIIAEAGEWFIQNRTGELSQAERQMFVTWLEASPIHVQEYLAIAETWQAVNIAGTSIPTPAEELIEAAKNASNVVMLDRKHPVTKKQIVHKRRLIVVVSAASLFALVGVMMLMETFAPLSGNIYATGRGEQRSVVLDDGSVIQLNTLSTMVVRYDEHQRKVTLKDGEAFFRVAHDPARPFDVVTELATVRAIGTQFNVYRRGDRLKVAVVEGRVSVASPSRENLSAPAAVQRVGAAALSLGPNEGVEMRGESATVRSDSAATATAWRQRRLSFDNERLDTVIAEFNRYTPRQMQVRDPSLAELRISGVFDADEPETLVTYLTQIQNVQVMRKGSSIVLSPRAHANTVE